MIAIYFGVVALLVALDQLVKFLIVQNISLGDTKTVVEGLFSLTYLQNTGAAWSIMEGNQVFFFIVTLIASIACLYYLPKYIKTNSGMSIGITLIFSGTLGNFIDRVRLGYVVDMFQLDFINFPIFNVADMALVVGVGLIILFTFLEEKKNQVAEKEKGEVHGDT